MKTGPVLAWHFTSDALRDGTPVPAIGVPLKHKGKLIICEAGLHASIDPIDALQYAPGPMLHRVACGGRIIHQDDKLVCSKRVIVASIDATDLLRSFARAEALTVAHLWDMPAAVREYLETGREDLSAAASAAAWDAAWDAAWAPAWAAAWAPAWAARRIRFTVAVHAAFGRLHCAAKLTQSHT